MSGPVPIEADPSRIGGVPKAPFVLLADPRRLFRQRASRFEALAPGHAMSPYLRFLGALTALQADLAAADAGAAPLPATEVDRAIDHAMPPLDRSALALRPEVVPLLHRLFDAAGKIEKPRAAAEALEAVRGAGDLDVLVANVLAEAIPPDALAQHLYVSLGIQVVAVRLASSLDAARLTPVATGLCPVCGGPPVTSVVVGFQGAEGARYAACSLCATLWNEVRVKCLACGSTKGIGYREVAGEAAGDTEAATVKAEVCEACRAWVKILYQNKNPSLDPLADDVASLGLDLLLRDAGYRHAGFNPFMLGY